MTQSETRPPYDNRLAHIVADALTSLGDGEYITSFDEDETFDRVVTVVTDSVRAALGDGHYIDFGPLRWTVEHSIDCRLSGRMSECEFHTRIVAWIENADGWDDSGRWLIRGFDERGTPDLIEPPESGDNDHGSSL